MKKKKRRIVVWISRTGLLKIALSTVLVALIAVIYMYQLPATRTWSEWTLPLSGKTIGVDAGHGGVDGGAQSKSGIVEKDLNLAVARQLRDFLQEAGAVVYMTREEDIDLAQPGTKGLSNRKTEDLHARAEFIENKKTDIFLSIHMNATRSTRWYGAQTFYYPGHPDNYTLSSLIQNEIKQNLGNTDRVVKQLETSYLLKTLTMPSALVEVGFLSNPEEAKRLANADYQKKVAAAIYQGILRYYAGEKVPKTN
jgi:N-acetylmuramoyl-L-alanine amidase